MTELLASPEVVCEDTSALTRQDWLALRKTGIGSSDAAAALGLSPWISQYHLWAEKSGHLSDAIEERDRFLVGREFEPIILRLWAELAEMPLDLIDRHVMLRSREHPHMLANPDGLTDDAVIEVKTCSEFDKKRWEDGVPDQYVIQGLHLMAVSGRRRCIYPVMFGFNFPETFEVEWNDETAAAMTTIEDEMWRRIVSHEPPDPDGSESTMMAIREQFYPVEQGTVVQLPQNTRQILTERAFEVESSKVHAERAEACKARLMTLLGTAEEGELDGEIVVTWRANKNGQRTMRFPETRAS